MKRTCVSVLAAAVLIFAVNISLAKKSAGNKTGDHPELNSDLISGLAFRSIGPALMSGRIGDIAVDPIRRSTWYVAVSSGNLWKTSNAGTTWHPVFDSYGSYSIGCVTVDPNNHLIIWVGTGENNSQRSVGYGDGIYKSLDGGKHFENMGLKNSEHIARILVDPRNSDVIYAAAQGPLWATGGDRGLFKSDDGGKTWRPSLVISENCGVTDIQFDPRNPDVIYAAAYQRRRRVWTLIDGGAESGVYKTTDAGSTWKKINRGLPKVDKGRIGLAVSPIKPDIVYAIVEAARGKSGFFRSQDGGENWKKMSDYITSSPQYYQEIFADPFVFDRVYSLDTYMMVSSDGGKTFEKFGREFKHVDDHALVFDPGDPEHLIIGCDGGIYETWDWGKNYDFKDNLPVTQFYKIAVDNDEPFYNVYGGTQDNATQGGPSRTKNIHGIRNSDWFVTVFGDGFDPAVDPKDPDIVYSQWQYGGLIRFDRKNGERIDIKPRENKEGPSLRWNWDSALFISPHSHTRLYYGAQILFRSDDRGDSWRPVSGDLTRNLDRNKLKVMGKVWSVDAVAKNKSTSFYGTIVALSESPLKEGLLYAGTDDGVIQMTDNGGGNWRRMDDFPGVPRYTYVNDIEASLHDPDAVYAVFNNHKRGDFKPYLLKSANRGKSWESITGNLPERGSVYTIVQDHIKPGLLFAGTEFGVFFTVDGGKKWIKLGKGIPTIAVRDLEIQKRENDLVAGTFGRGFYILDDYSPLRHIDENMLKSEAAIFPIKKAWMYIQEAPLAGKGKAWQGASFFTAPNPPFGATFTYYLKENLSTKKEERQKAEDELIKDKKDVYYPAWEDLKKEHREEPPAVILTVRDNKGAVVRRLKGDKTKGIHRATWDFRYPGSEPAKLHSGDYGPLAVPGRYTVSIDKMIDGAAKELVPPVEFMVEPLGQSSLPAADREALLMFERKTAELQRAVLGAQAVLAEAEREIKFMKAAVMRTPSLDYSVNEAIRSTEIELMDIKDKLTGSSVRRKHSEPAMPGIIGRLNQIISGHWSATSAPTGTHKENYDIASEEFRGIQDRIKKLIEVDLARLEKILDDAGAPWTPGRGVPAWDE